MKESTIKSIPEETIIQREEAEDSYKRIGEFFRSLSPSQLLTLLPYWSGASQQEIASAFVRSESAVERSLAEARVKAEKVFGTEALAGRNGPRHFPNSRLETISELIDDLY
ncbi:MAG: hypothetical protein AAB874_01110 [Patescibacteria group bacterium]